MDVYYSDLDDLYTTVDGRERTASVSFDSISSQT